MGNCAKILETVLELLLTVGLSGRAKGDIFVKICLLSQSLGLIVEVRPNFYGLFQFQETNWEVLLLRRFITKLE